VAERLEIQWPAEPEEHDYPSAPSYLNLISDDEVAARERELESGAVEPLSHEEFVRRVQANRRR